MGAEFPERWEDHELAGTGDDRLVLQLPSVLVGGRRLQMTVRNLLQAARINFSLAATLSV